MKIILNRSIYNVLSENIMKQRGILRESETIEDALTRVLSALITIDRELNSHSGYSCERDHRLSPSVIT